MNEADGNLYFFPVMTVVGVAASESRFYFHSPSRVVLTMSDSAPHATDMGRVESEPAFVHYSSNSLRRSLGFMFRDPLPISQLHYM